MGGRLRSGLPDLLVRELEALAGRREKKDFFSGGLGYTSLASHPILIVVLWR